MIICPVRILLNTFHIFQSAGEQFLLFPGISTLGHFVPKLRNGASAPGRRQPGLGRLPNKHFGKYFSAARRKNLECVHTRIACQKRKCGYACPACSYCPEFGIQSVIPKVRLSRILQRKPVTKAFLKEIFGITFCVSLSLKREATYNYSKDSG